MNIPEKLNDLIAELIDVSDKILSKMVPIMKNLLEPDNDYVEEISYSTKIQDKEILNLWLQQQTVSSVSNAENVKKEAVNFLKSYKKDPDETLYKNVKQYPFLAEVWFGDNYDGKEGVEALKYLLEELKTDLACSDEDFYIEKAISHFSKINYKS